MHILFNVLSPGCTLIPVAQDVNYFIVVTTSKIVEAELDSIFPLKRIILGGIHLRFSEDVPLFVTAVTEEL